MRRGLIVAFVGALLGCAAYFSGRSDFNAVSSTSTEPHTSAEPNATAEPRQASNATIALRDHQPLFDNAGASTAEELFEFPQWWTEAEKLSRGAFLVQVLRRAAAEQQPVDSEADVKRVPNSFLANERLASRTISSTCIHWNAPADSGTSGEAAVGETRAAFLCCVRDWLYDFLKNKATRAPSPARWRMGEVRTWTALLESLLSLGAEVVLSANCAELPTWEHTAPDHAGGGGGVLRVFLTEDLSLHFLRKLPLKVRCRRFKATIAVAGERSKFFPMSRVLPLFHVVQHNRSLGLIARCADTPPTFKAWYALLWGKSKQTAVVARLLRRSAAALVPIVSSCASQCDPQLPTVRIRSSNRSTAVFDLLLRHAAMLLGPAAPNVGATCAEALACGTHVVARGRSFGFEFAGHPLVRRFRSPAEFHSAVNATMRELGFDPSVRFDEQRRLPQALSRPTAEHLPPRYSTAGHRNHVAQLLGLDTASPRGVINHSILAVAWHAGVPTLTGVGELRGETALASAFASQASWEGC